MRRSSARLSYSADTSSYIRATVFTIERGRQEKNSNADREGAASVKIVDLKEKGRIGRGKSEMT